MLKKILIAGCVLGGLITFNSVANAETELFIKKEMFPQNVILHEPGESLDIPCIHMPSVKSQPEIITEDDVMEDSFEEVTEETPEEVTQEENDEESCSTTSCEENKPCPIETEEEPFKQPCTKSASCEDMKAIFAQIDQKVGLNKVQQAKVNILRKTACRQIKPLMAEIANKQGEITSLQRTKMSDIEIKKRTKLLNKEIKNLQKQVKIIKKQADMQYKNLLTPAQKSAYKKAKKELKGKMPCDVQKGCPIQNTTVEKCPCGIPSCDCEGECNCAEEKVSSEKCPCGIEDCDCDCEGECNCDETKTQNTDCPCGIPSCECKKCSCTQCMCDETDNCGCKEPCTCK